MTEVTVKRATRRGRPPRLTETQKDAIVIQYNNGTTQKDLATEFRVSLSTIRKTLEERRQ